MKNTNSRSKKQMGGTKSSFLESSKELKFGGISKYKQGGIEDRDAGYGSSLKKDDYAGRTTRPKRGTPIPSKSTSSVTSIKKPSLVDTGSSKANVQTAVDTKTKEWGEGFSAAFAEARRRGKTTFEFKGRQFGTRKKGETKAEHAAAMQSARPQTLQKKQAGNISTGVEGPKLQTSRVTVPQPKSKKDRRQENKSKAKSSTSSAQRAASPKYSKSSGKSMKGKYVNGTPGGVQPSGRNPQFWDPSSGMTESEFYRKQGEMAEGAKSFDQAFAAARRAGQTTFTWKGKTYGTRLAGESKSQNASRMATASVTQGKTATPASTGTGKSVKTLLGTLENTASKTTARPAAPVGKTFSKSPTVAPSGSKVMSKSAPSSAPQGKSYVKSKPSIMTDRRTSNKENRKNRRAAVKAVKQSYKR